MAYQGYGDYDYDACPGCVNEYYDPTYGAPLRGGQEDVVKQGRLGIFAPQYVAPFVGWLVGFASGVLAIKLMSAHDPGYGEFFPSVLSPLPPNQQPQQPCCACRPQPRW